jgi:MFS family permease
LLKGGILAMPQFLQYFNYPSNFTQGGITASIQAGAFAGSLLTGAFLADTLGRKKTILLGSALFTVGCAIACAANGIEALVAGRVINGIGNGCLAMMVPLYQSEIAPREYGRHLHNIECADIGN